MRVKTDGNKLKLYGIIWEGDGQYVAEAIEEASALHPVLEIDLNTKGGSVFDGDEIYNAMLSCGSDIDLTVVGLAASMGSVLMLPTRTTKMARGAYVMTHAPSAGVRGTAEEMEKAAKLLRNMETNFLRRYAAKTGKTQAKLKHLLEGDNWFSAEECETMGLVDEIVDDVFDKKEIEALKLMEVTAKLKGNDPFEMSLRDVQKPTKETKPKDIINNSTMKKELIAAFAFMATAGITEASSDTAMITAMSKHITDLEGKVVAADAKVKALEDANAAKEKTAITDAVAAAIKAGKITAEQEGTFVNIGESSGIDNLNAAFAAMGGKKSIVAAIQSGGSANSGKSWDEQIKEDPQAMEKLKDSDLDSFKALFKAKFGTEFKD